VDRSEINSEYGDLAYVAIEIVDQDNCVVKWADTEISVEASGAGELIAIGAANPTSEELYVGNQRKAWQGRFMSVVRSSGQPGEILLKASANGLSATEIRIKTISAL
jgi:beta-galactosidase